MEEDEAPDAREVRISKALTLILRNKALIRGLHVASDGYVLAEDVLHCPPVARHGATMSDIQKITFESKKQRFQLKQGLDGNGGPIYIWAVQGHSMTVVRDENLGRRLLADDVDLPSECVHGTYWEHLSSILENGLMAGGKRGLAFRNHVHFLARAGRLACDLRHAPRL
jgi:2'-phosphotransferase